VIAAGQIRVRGNASSDGQMLGGARHAEHFQRSIHICRGRNRDIRASKAAERASGDLVSLNGDFIVPLLSDSPDWQSESPNPVVVHRF
jgi:hypothetical protein